jgi:hypothetical protein
MDIEIKINNKVVEIFLCDGGIVVSSAIIAEEHRLSEDLLPEIDKLIISAGLSVRDIEKMVLQSDMGENFTTQRIALTVVQAFNWSRAVDN